MKTGPNRSHAVSISDTPVCSTSIQLIYSTLHFQNRILTAHSSVEVQHPRWTVVFYIRWHGHKVLCRNQWLFSNSTLAGSNWRRPESWNLSAVGATEANALAQGARWSLRDSKSNNQSSKFGKRILSYWAFATQATLLSATGGRQHRTLHDIPKFSW